MNAADTDVRSLHSGLASECRRLAAVVAAVAAAAAGMCPLAVQASEQRVDSAVITRQIERRGRAEVPVEVTKRGSRVVLQTADRSVAVSNPEVLSRDVRQLPVRVSVTRGEAAAVRIDGVRLQAALAWEQRSSRTKSKFAAVTSAVTRVDTAAARALSPTGTEADFSSLKGEMRLAKREIVRAYRELPADATAEQRVLVEQHSELRRADKALYVRDDRYPPQTYSRIFETSRGSFALKERGALEPRCSGVLIGDNLALTNNHCLLENIPQELEAEFDYETDLDGQPLPVRSFPIVDFVVSTEEQRAGLDFALLELGPGADGRLPGSVYGRQCLSLRRAKRDDALYVVGFPLGGPRTVHDNAFVYFPYEVTADEFAELEILVRQEFDSLSEEQDSFREGKLKEFRESYRAKTVDGVEMFEYVSTRFGGQPTIGADSDTYRGNSGSPVFDRRTHHVVGILFDGQEDLAEPWQPGWRAHEAILPTPRIVAQLDAAFPTWRQDPSICTLE